MSETIDRVCPICKKSIFDDQDEYVMEGANEDVAIHDECHNQIWEENYLRNRVEDAVAAIRDALDEYHQRKCCNKEVETEKTKHAVKKLGSILWVEELDKIL